MATSSEPKAVESLAREIERTTMRKLSMEVSLVDHLAKCHQQDQSPLYSKIPKEIRDMIFEYATAQDEDMENKYDETAYYRRPGYRAPHKTFTNLLLTCRRVWLETNALPIKQSTFTYWFSKGRGPKKQQQGSFREDSSRLRSRLTQLNTENFTTLQFFLQMYEAERMFHSGSDELRMISSLKPKNFRITIRHTDWWWWERDEQLKLNPIWIQRILGANSMAGVEEFSLELETLEKNKDQLRRIVDGVSRLEGKPLSGAHEQSERIQLKLDGTPKVSNWAGPINIDGQEFENYKGLEQLEYRIVTLTWKARKVTGIEMDAEAASETRNDDRMGARIVPQAYRRTREAPSMSVHRMRLHLVRGGWNEKQFPFAQFRLRVHADEISRKTEDQMRSRFNHMFADVEAKKLESEWKAKGLLLKFASTDSMA